VVKSAAPIYTDVGTSMGKLESRGDGRTSIDPTEVIQTVKYGTVGVDVEFDLTVAFGFVVVR
jgi:hypothetical protein